HPRRKASLHHQRQLERRHRDRRGHQYRAEVDPRRAAALGRRRRPPIRPGHRRTDPDTQEKRERNMTRLLIAAMLAALIGAPAQAQTATDAPADDAAAQAAPAADAAGEDDDDDDDDAPAAAASTVQHHDFGPSGIMARSNREDLAP